MRKTGLPENISMRHDFHFVELIAAKTPAPRIRLIPINKIDPNPHQPRSELGDLQELMASIKSKGILEPILVRPKGDRFEIIAGERRYVAATNVGLTEVPCIEMNVSDHEALEISLIENLQRKDLDVFEEADGLKTLIDLYGYSHQQLAEKIGKARSTITEIINVSRIPFPLRSLCKKHGILTRSTLIEIAKLDKEEDMEKLIHQIIEKGLKREDTRQLSKQIKGKIKKAKPFIFRFLPKDKKYVLKIEFKKENVSKNELIAILEEILSKLKSGDL
ncbi:MAG: ParB/RepB/Spo0J family partition protein [Candidatus Aminicenantes bacterium]|nr:ParB/RepB/Spo0J family partition protein [Candidatus Aminicenantes bacterium]